MADPELFADPPHVPIEKEPTDPQIGFVPETVGQAPSPAPGPLVRLSEPSTQPTDKQSTYMEIGFVPPISGPAPTIPPQQPDFQLAARLTPEVCGGLADMKPVKAGL